MSKPFQFFTAEDFESSRCDCSPYQTNCKCNKWPSQEIADRANAILNERGKRVFQCDNSNSEWGTTARSEPCPDCTHEALLVGEREIEK